MTKQRREKTVHNRRYLTVTISVGRQLTEHQGLGHRNDAVTLVPRHRWRTASSLRLFQHEPDLAHVPEGTGAKVVITSAWRKVHTLTQLCELMPSLAPRIVGVTRNLSHRPRPEKIQDWLRRRQYKRADWLALDDNQLWFQTCMDRLTACDGDVGLQEKQLEAVRSWVAKGQTQ